MGSETTSSPADRLNAVDNRGIGVELGAAGTCLRRHASNSTEEQIPEDVELRIGVTASVHDLFEGSIRYTDSNPCTHGVLELALLKPKRYWNQTLGDSHSSHTAPNPPAREM